MDLDCYSDLVDDIVSFCKNGNVGEDNASNKSEGSEDCYMPDEKRLNKPGIREELDAHVCEGLFRTFRKRDEDPEKVIPNSRIDTLFLGVAMMEAGATISRDNLEYLRSIIRAYRPSRKDTKEPGKFAHGMYNTGQAQMVTAVDLYQAGTPRNFHADWSVSSFLSSFHHLLFFSPLLKEERC